MRTRTWVALLLATVVFAVGVWSLQSTGSDQVVDAPPTVGPSVTPSPSLTSTPSPTPSPSPSPSPLPVVGAVDADRAVALATYLAVDIGPRPAGGDGDTAARSYVAEILTAAGYTVVEEPFDLPQGGTSANVVAWWGDTDPRTEPHVVVGGHLDTIGGPGANDNASGVGLILATAEEFADEVAVGDVPLPIVWVAFGAEEYQPSSPKQHHLGSEKYASAYGEHVVAMLAVDMLANGAKTCLCRLKDSPRQLQDRLLSIAARDGLADFQPEARGDVSDHGPFASRGVPAVLLWTYLSEGYHGPGDTVDRIHVEDLRRSAVLIAAFLRDLGSDDQPRVRAAS